MTNITKILLLATYIISFISCERNTGDDATRDIQSSLTNFLHNIPISGDTILIDNNYDFRYGNDFKVEVDGYTTKKVKLVIDSYDTCTYDNPIINTCTFGRSTGIHDIQFLIQATRKDNGQEVSFKSNTFFLKVVKNLSGRFMKVFPSNGSLVISWTSLDKKGTKKFLIERLVGEHLELIHTFEQTDTVLIDPYYVGEEVMYKIYSIDNQDVKLKTWYYQKSGEKVEFSIGQSTGGGYDLHFSKCKYYNNFGQNYLTDGHNFNPVFLFSSSDINDTVFHITGAKFGEEARFWLQYLPSQLPNGIIHDNYIVYGKFLSSVYGDKSFSFENIAKSEGGKIIYTKDGHLFVRQYETGLLLDSLKTSSYFGFLRTTPAGKYVYAINQNASNSPVCIWPASDISVVPERLKIGFLVPPISDNMVTIMLVSDKWSVCYVPDGSVLCSTDYKTDINPVISSDGNYFMLNSSCLKLFSYKDNILNLIWENTNPLKYYNFYQFNPYHPVCYTWDEARKFSIMNISDFSEITSYTLNAGRIINIDYESERIMAISDKIEIYNLSDGKLITRIPASLSNLFYSGNQSLLIGNYIYANNGVRYDIRK